MDEIKLMVVSFLDTLDAMDVGDQIRWLNGQGNSMKKHLAKYHERFMRFVPLMKRCGYVVEDRYGYSLTPKSHKWLEANNGCGSTDGVQSTVVGA